MNIENRIGTKSGEERAARQDGRKLQARRKYPLFVFPSVGKSPTPNEQERNGKAAVFETVKPYIFGLLEKYEGKAYGEKTARKITDEAREACGFYIFFAEEYGSAKIRITEAGSYCNNDANITITAQGLDIFGGELKNRLRAPLESEKAAFRIAYERARYTEPEQIDARIDEIITAQEEARRAQEAYNAAIDKYNAVIAGKMESLKREYQRIDK